MLFMQEVAEVVKCIFIYLFGVLHCFQHCTGHITMGSLKGRGNQYIQLVKVLYCKLLTNGKQLLLVGTLQYTTLTNCMY